MPSIKDLKKRIGTVKNTQQTTKAMKMVSAAKLRRAQEAIGNQRPYANGLREMLTALLRACGGQVKSPLLEREKPAAGHESKAALLVVTSDRGLCAGFNNNAIKFVSRWLKEEGARFGSVEVHFLGRRGYDFFKTKNVNVGGYYPELGGKVTFAKAKKMSRVLTDLYTSERVDEVFVLFNEFKNAASQRPVAERLLPVATDGATGGSSAPIDLGDPILKPSASELAADLLERNLPMQVFRIMLESQAGEHGARMSAMENATKNAGDMIRKLTLQYNKQRQAGITKELLEIISGSEAQKVS